MPNPLREVNPTGSEAVPSNRASKKGNKQRGVNKPIVVPPPPPPEEPTPLNGVEFEEEEEPSEVESI